MLRSSSLCLRRRKVQAEAVRVQASQSQAAADKMCSHDALADVCRKVEKGWGYQCEPF